MKKLILSIALIGLIASCDSAQKATEDTAVTNDDAQFDKHTFDMDYLNTSVRPQEDFFEFANGSWIKNNPVPASESSWGSFNELDDANKKKLTAILEEFKDSKAAQGTLPQILGHYYSSFVNMDRRNALGIDPLESEIQDVLKLGDKKSIARLIAKHHELGIGSLFSFGVTQDMMDIDHHIAGFWQGGIGLPNKDYYCSEDKKEILEKYHYHIVKIFTVLRYPAEEAKKIADDVINFETKLANNMMAPAELRIPEKTYNKMSMTELKRTMGGFDIEGYIRETGIDSFDSLVVGQPEFVQGISSLIENVDLPTWKNYLLWKVIDHYAGHLNREIVMLNFSFYSGVLSGKTEMKPLNEQAINEITHQPFGELLGKAFVGRHFSDAAQQRVNTMVDNLLDVFRERIEGLEWMSKDTKKQALIKLEGIGRKLGFPTKWEDFSSLNFSHDNYIDNIREIARYSRKKNLAELHQDVDKDKWEMPAHMINAYYHPLLNEIAFPAGIMQAPFFSNDYEDAVNYGRIGMVIGHEFTHGFDDMGSKFAADGSFRNWWTDADKKAFEKRTALLGNTFADFCPIDGHCVNPDLTMGENIADLGGLTMAYYAYTRTDEFQSGVLRNGYTPAQRFFIAYAQLWKINYTEEALKNRISNDPHSPGMYRVNGPLMNCPEFFAAFDVQEGDNMRNPSAKVANIW
ncbi:MAG: M13 family metallopeptidase [Crocinitomicaceae bacterium]|nr:M13 family metallopeptidase [Crocinitomicaceae bacterium]